MNNFIAEWEIRQEIDITCGNNTVLKELLICKSVNTISFKLMVIFYEISERLVNRFPSHKDDLIQSAVTSCCEHCYKFNENKSHKATEYIMQIILSKMTTEYYRFKKYDDNKMISL